MSYQVIARKYRPQRFSEVIGQEHITTTLKNALASQRIHHAYLFTGVRGVGKTTVARILARALNCQHPVDFEPCGQCGPCQEITSSRSLDVQEIDGASNNSVDNIREIREHAKYLPSSSRYKIYIIDEVHMLSDSAFNALLKTLEEPPAHLLFIFATTEAHDIPATILSRCQRHDFRRITAPLIAATLRKIAQHEQIEASDDALAMIAREATGSLRDAQSLFDQAIAYSGSAVSVQSVASMLGALDRTLIFETVQAAFAHDAPAALAALEKVFAAGGDLTRFAGEVLEILRHVIVIAAAGTERLALDLPADEIATLTTLAQANDITRLHQMFTLWYGVTESTARSAFPKMLLEVGLIRLTRTETVRPVSELMAQVSELLAGREQTTPSRTSPSAPREIVSSPKPARHVVSSPAPSSAPVPIATNAPASRVPTAAATPHATSPTFEPAPAADIEAQRNWESFMRMMAVERPQAAAILSHARFEGIEGMCVRLRFENQHFADLQAEEPRRVKLEEMLATHFKRPLRIQINAEGPCPEAVNTNPTTNRAARKKELVREALASDIVKQAADILGAQLHDVKATEK